MTNEVNKIPENDKILSSNKQLKDKLQEVKLLIETTIAKYTKRFNRNNNPPNKGDEEESQKEAVVFRETVAHYKEIITELNNELLLGFTSRKLQAQENELRNHQSKLEELENENKSLKTIKVRQAKGIEEFENKYNNKVERVVLTEKQKNLKQEWKIVKDYYDNQMTTLKKQQNEINGLLAHCELVKSNIHRKKRLNRSIDNADDKPHLINSLKDQAHQVELNAKNEEMNFIAHIKQQKDKSNRLDEDIAIIKVQIKQKEQEIRISQLKCKELKKLKYHSRLLKTQLNKFKMNPLTKTNTSTKNLSLFNDPKSRHTLNKDNSTQLMRENKFEEIDIDEYEKEKSRVMYDIENLKNEIQKAINRDASNEIYKQKEKRKNISNDMNQIYSDVKQADRFEYLGESKKYDDNDNDNDDNNEENYLEISHSNEKQTPRKSNELDENDDELNNHNKQSRLNEDEIEEDIETNKALNLQIGKGHHDVYIQGDSKNSRKPFGDFGFPKEEKR